jgi:competence protein ComEA
LNEPPATPEPRPAALWLRRADQACAAVVVAVSLAVIAVYWVKEWGRQGELIDVEHPAPPPIDYQIDINVAPWPEFAVLPGLGEVLAKRIVESREQQGPFCDHDDLRRVRGIGPRTLERLRPYLAPLPSAESVAGPP